MSVDVHKLVLLIKEAYIGAVIGQVYMLLHLLARSECSDLAFTAYT
jgi:hypothetical protein